MAKYNKPKQELDIVEINPFIDTFSIPCSTMYDNVRLDSTDYVKVYTTPDIRKRISKLSVKSRSLFLWLMYEILPGEDSLWLNRDRYMEETDTSLNTYKAASKELIQEDIIKDYNKVISFYLQNPKLSFRSLEKMAGVPRDNVSWYVNRYQILKALNKLY